MYPKTFQYLVTDFSIKPSVKLSNHYAVNLALNWRKNRNTIPWSRVGRIRWRAGCLRRVRAYEKLRIDWASVIRLRQLSHHIQCSTIEWSRSLWWELLVGGLGTAEIPDFSASITVCRPTSPQLQYWLFIGTTSKPNSFPDHFLPDCFWFLVLYTVYSSGLAVLYLGHSK